MKFEVVEPLEKHRTTYEGGAVFLTEPSQMADPSGAFRNNPHKKVSVDITHEAVGPVYGSTRRATARSSTRRRRSRGPTTSST